MPESTFTGQQKVTVRRLLSHTAGTTVSGFGGYRRGVAIATLVQILNGQPPANSPPIVVDKTPGGSFRYSGGGYVILQQLLVDVAQQPVRDDPREWVLAPLAMSASTFGQPLPEDRAADASAGHDDQGGVILGRHHTCPEQAAAGLWTTARNLAGFLLELQLSLKGEGDRILDKETVEAIPLGGGGMGLGMVVWENGGQPYFGHDGANAGFRASAQAHRTAGVGAVVMTNGNNGLPLAARIMEIIGRHEKWPGY